MSSFKVCDFKKWFSPRPPFLFYKGKSWIVPVDISLSTWLSTKLSTIGVKSRSLNAYKEEMQYV